MAEELLPSLFNLIDETYEDIGMIDNQDRKDDAALRLVSVLYSLGITIHPALDGNGQTFKAMVLTYLHELTSVYRGKYFAIKFSSELHDKDTKIETLNLPKKFAELNIPKVEPANEEDSQLLEMFQDLSLMRTISPGENIKWQDNLNELEVQIYTLAKKNADQFKLPNLIERSTTSQNQHSPKL